MEFKIGLDQLRQRSIFLATPMYGGQCNGQFTQSIAQLAALCQHYGIRLLPFFLFNESLITRARNYCVDEFLRSDYTHLMFLDSDIGFDPNDVIALLALSGEDTPYDIIGGAYPKKAISWEKILLAVNKGAADEDPDNLANFVGDYVFNPVIDPNVSEQQIPLGEPAEVLELGTGFMMIRRSTFDKYKAHYGDVKSYLPDHARSENFDGSREITMYFQAEIDPESKRYLSEDYLFCQEVRKMGGKVWLCPWMQLKHVGTYTFGGSLAAIASIGASATVDRTATEKKKRKDKRNKRRR